MIIEVYNAHTLEKIVTADCEEECISRSEGNWILNITYYDEVAEEDITDSMILTEATSHDALDDLIIIQYTAGHIEIFTNEDYSDSLKAARSEFIINALKMQLVKCRSASMYGKSVKEGI